MPSFTSKCEDLFTDFNITEQEIIDVLSTLNVHKANGPDGISHEMLKQTRRTICKPLCLIFNKSIQDGSYPHVWKKANVMPKKGEKICHRITDQFRSLAA